MANKQQDQAAELAALLALKKTRIDFESRRGRLIREEDRWHVITLIEEAVAAGARR